MAASANQDWRDWDGEAIKTGGQVLTIMRVSDRRLQRLQFMVETGRDVSAGLMPTKILYMTDSEWGARFGTDFAHWLALRQGSA